MIPGQPERPDGGHTAYDVTDARLLLRDFEEFELKQIPVLPPGTHLEAGAAYVDLRDPAREEVRAAEGATAGEAQLLVPKAEVHYQVWNRLTQRERVPAGQTGG